MNLGGEPERDDSGLPPVDIQVPDDARELDRDVQAYRRELRALRRHQRRLRLHRPLTRDGMVLPLLASCLVLALIAGTLLVVFTARPGGELPGATGTIPTASPSRSASRASADPLRVVPGGKLPDKSVEITGTQVPLLSLAPAVLALVPADCNCTPAVIELIRQSVAARVQLYLVGVHGHLAAVQQLAARAPLGQAVAAEDSSGVLYGTYRPTKLTAVLARPDGSVSVAAPLSTGFQLGHQLSSLTAATAPAASSP